MNHIVRRLHEILPAQFQHYGAAPADNIVDKVFKAASRLLRDPDDDTSPLSLDKYSCVENHMLELQDRLLALFVPAFTYRGYFVQDERYVHVLREVLRLDPSSKWYALTEENSDLSPQVLIDESRSSIGRRRDAKDADADADDGVKPTLDEVVRAHPVLKLSLWLRYRRGCLFLPKDRKQVDDVLGVSAESVEEQDSRAYWKEYYRLYHTRDPARERQWLGTESPSDDGC